MKRSISYSCLLILMTLSILACKDKKKETAGTTGIEQVGKIVEATYENATVYTGKTDYIFLTAEDEEIRVEVSNFEEKPSILLPEGLLESPDTLDGLIGANPLVQGQLFKLYYSEAGEVYKVSLK